MMTINEIWQYEQPEKYMSAVLQKSVGFFLNVHKCDKPFRSYVINLELVYIPRLLLHFPLHLHLGFYFHVGGRCNNFVFCSFRWAMKGNAFVFIKCTGQKKIKWNLYVRKLWNSPFSWRIIINNYIDTNVYPGEVKTAINDLTNQYLLPLYKRTNYWHRVWIDLLHRFIFSKSK